MSLCFVLGGAACVWDDLSAAVEIAGERPVIACNDAASVYPGELEAFCTLHPDKLPAWITERERLGHPKPKRVIAHQRKTMQTGAGGDLVTEVMDFRWTGHSGVSGSSGLYCVKVAFEVLRFDKVILCGVPMDDGPHFFDSSKWDAVRNFKMTWQQLEPVLRGRVKSMGGWTAELLGRPDAEWIG